MSDSIERHGERFGIYPLGGQLYAEGMHVTGGTVTVGASALPDGAATADNQTNGDQRTRIVDLHGHEVNVQQISAATDGDEYGALTISMLHGKSTAHGGTWVDVKVSPSGALQVETTPANGTPQVVTRDDDFFSDAFQRLRVSNTDQRLDVEFLYDKQPLLFEELVTGTGTVTHNTNARDVTIAIGGTASNAAAGLFQHYYNPYTPGNSQFVALTGVLNGANLAGTAAIFRRSYVTGTATEEVINQTSWLAATSGVNWNYSQIFLMDFQSLKIGRIRFALDRGGLAVPVATIDNDNERAEGYWQLANAPIFWRTYNTATNTVTELGYGDAFNAIGFRFTSALDATQTMRATCATVKSEGGGNLLDIAGYKAAAANGATLRTVSNSFLPVLSLQLKSTFGAGTNRGLVFPQALSIQCDNPIYYEVRINPALTNASFASVNANSLCNVDVAATAITGGRVIAAGYASSGSTRAGATQVSLTGKAPLSVDYAGTVGDIITVACIRTSTTNAATGVAVEWKEVR